MILAAWLIAFGVICAALVLFVVEESRHRRANVGRGRVSEYWDGEERRTAKRIKTSLEVHYGIESADGPKRRSKTRDVSSGGLKLVINEKLAKGSLLWLDIILPGEHKPVMAEAKVVWIRGDFGERDESGRRLFFTGVRLAGFQPSHRSRFTSYIHDLETGTP